MLLPQRGNDSFLKLRASRQDRSVELNGLEIWGLGDQTLGSSCGSAPGSLGNLVIGLGHWAEEGGIG